MSLRSGRHLAVFLCLAVATAAQDGAFPGDLIRMISSFGPRFEGSEGEGRAIEFLRQTALSLGLETAADDLSGVRHSYSRSSSLLCLKPGRSEDRLIVAVSLDSGPRASDLDEGTDFTLALAVRLMQGVASWDSPAVGVEFAFLGAEFAPFDDMEGYPLGSLSLIAGFPEGRRTAILYLGSLQTGRPILLAAHGSGIVAPYWFFRRTLDGLSGSGLSVHHEAGSNQLFRTRLAEGGGAAAAFLERGIPAVEIKAARGTGGSPSDPELFAQALESALFRMAGAEASAFDTTWDRHYLVLGRGNGIFVLRERPFLVFILSMLLGFILFFTISSIVLRDGFIAFMKGVLRFILSLLFAFALCYAVIALASLAFAAWGRARGWPPLWSAYRPSWILSKSLLLAGLGGAFLTLALKIRLLPSSLAFYGGSAMALLFLDVLIFTSMDLSYSIFFAWAFVFCILAILIRSTAFAVVSYTITFAPLLLFAVEAAPVGGERLARILFLPGPVASVVLAFIFLPVLLLLVRILMLIRGREATGSRGRLLAGMAFGVISLVGGVAVLAASDPYGGKAVPIDVEASIEADGSGLSFTAKGGRGAERGILSWDGSTYEIPLSGPSEGYAVPPGHAFTLSSSRSTFLSRKTLRLTLGGGPAETLSVTVSGGGGASLYDCNLPFTTDPGTGYAEIHVGSHPRFPLILEMTVAGDFQGELRIVGRSALEAAILEPGFTLRGGSTTVSQAFAIE